MDRRRSFEKSFISSSKLRTYRKLSNTPNNDGTEERYERLIRELKEASDRKCAKWKGDSFEVQDYSVAQIEDEEKVLRLYEELMCRKHTEQEQAKANAKDMLFKQNSESKKLDSAFMCAEMLREQRAQREFNNKMKNKYKQEDRDYLKYIENKYEEWKHKEKLKTLERLEKAREASRQMKIQIDHNEVIRKNAKLEKLQNEKRERESISDEFARMEKENRDSKKRQQLAFKTFIESKLKQKELKTLNDRENEMNEEKINNIYENVRSRLSAMRKIQEKQIEVCKMKPRIAVRETFPRPADRKQEQREYEIARKTMLEMEVQRNKDIAERSEKIKQVRMQDYEDWLARKRDEKEREKSKREEESKNREINLDLTSTLKASLGQRGLKKVAEIKAFNLKQLNELKNKLAEERRSTVDFYGKKRLDYYAECDTKFFTYASQLLDECKTSNRPLQPLLKVIRDYMVRYAPSRKSVEELKARFPKVFSELHD